MRVFAVVASVSALFCVIALVHQAATAGRERRIPRSLGRARSRRLFACGAGVLVLLVTPRTATSQERHRLEVGPYFGYAENIGSMMDGWGGWLEAPHPGTGPGFGGRPAVRLKSETFVEASVAYSDSSAWLGGALGGSWGGHMRRYGGGPGVARRWPGVGTVSYDGNLIYGFRLSRWVSFVTAGFGGLTSCWIGVDRSGGRRRCGRQVLSQRPFRAPRRPAAIRGHTAPRDRIAGGSSGRAAPGRASAGHSRHQLRVLSPVQGPVLETIRTSFDWPAPACWPGASGCCDLAHHNQSCSSEIRQELSALRQPAGCRRLRHHGKVRDAAHHRSRNSSARRGTSVARPFW